MIATRDIIRYVELLWHEPKTREKMKDRYLKAAMVLDSASTEIDGFKATHGAGGGRGDGSSPVEAAVLGHGDGTREEVDEYGRTRTVVESNEACFVKPQRDVRAHKAGMALDHLQQAALAKLASMNWIDQFDKIGKPEKAPGKQTAGCKSAGCDGIAVERGWCDECVVWVADNPQPDELDPATVPGEVIAERTRRRAKAS